MKFLSVLAIFLILAVAAQAHTDSGELCMYCTGTTCGGEKKCNTYALGTCLVLQNPCTNSTLGNGIATYNEDQKQFVVSIFSNAKCEQAAVSTLSSVCDECKAFPPSISYQMTCPAEHEHESTTGASTKLTTTLFAIISLAIAALLF
ncbi:hypothetical protein CYY_006825 [Polysphondylium violaceum]|uniref:Uncharacterized protein n=1 Tax=Polysphondylium violaceum TaxID=133409 RepID=A0A8J4PQR8_9MYCE|nr:hypothetical protein CYY_006825 [Polysphondylium violaceum]